LKAYEREQQAQGVNVEALGAPKTLTRGYVAFFHDRLGQPLAGKVIHADRYCQHIADLPNADVREATEDERERLGPCGTCG